MNPTQAPRREPELAHELGRAKATIAQLRYVLLHAPPRQSVTDQRYWDWLTLRDKALNGTFVIPA